MKKSARVVPAFILCVIGWPIVARTSAPAPVALRAAIDWGISGDPQPYLLRHAQGVGTNDVVVGAVYTPFLRVALAAHAAWADGHELTPAEIRPTLTEPVLDIAIRWYAIRCPVEEPPRAPTVLVVPKDTPFVRNLAGAPPSTVRPVTYLQSFGGQLPYSDVAVVISYPLKVLRGDVDFVVFKSGVLEDGRQGDCVERGRIPLSELSAWR